MITRKSRKLMSLLLFLGLSFVAAAQFEFPVMTIRGAGMGGSSVALNDAASSLHNIAGLARRTGATLATTYRNDFLLTGTAHKWLAASASLSPTGSAVANYHHYGNSHYSEQRLSMGYAQAVSKQIALGATLDYLYSGTDNAYYPPQKALTFTVSMQATLGQRWTLGARLFNPAAVHFSGDDGDRLPTQLTVGAACQVLPDWLSTLEVEKTLYAPATLRAGVEYTFFKHFAARAGLAFQPLVYSFGLGFNHTHYSLDLSTTIHPTLGLTPLVGGSYTF